jgi:hypothetical protein
MKVGMKYLIMEGLKVLAGILYQPQVSHVLEKEEY